MVMTTGEDFLHLCVAAVGLQNWCCHRIGRFSLFFFSLFLFHIPCPIGPIQSLPPHPIWFLTPNPHPITNTTPAPIPTTARPPDRYPHNVGPYSRSVPTTRTQSLPPQPQPLFSHAISAWKWKENLNGADKLNICASNTSRKTRVITEDIISFMHARTCEDEGEKEKGEEEKD